MTAPKHTDVQIADAPVRLNINLSLNGFASTTRLKKHHLSPRSTPITFSQIYLRYKSAQAHCNKVDPVLLTSERKCILLPRDGNDR